MNYNFADRMSCLNASAIREILKFATNPSVISLAAGSPSKEAFPYAKIEKITENILKNQPTLALQYNISEGYLPLRDFCLDMLKSQNSVYDFDNILITSGAQQAIELVSKAFINKNDTILCENPSFLGSLNAFKSFECNLVGVSSDDEGICLIDLENKLKTNKNVKFLYIIPNFSNPTGITLSLERREKIYALAQKYDTLILEDNPYGELRFSGESIPHIKSLDVDGRVIYCGSFSKVLSPGLRVGFALCHNDIIEKLIVCKQCSDVHTPMLSQLICYEFISKNDFNAHIDTLKALYKQKCELMLAQIHEKFDKRIAFTKPDGGLFIWCTLPDGISMPDFCKIAILNNVAVVPGNAFLTDETLPCQSFRINYSTPTDEQIIQAIDILSKINLDSIQN